MIKKTLRVILAEKNIKQKTLAEAIGVTPEYICTALNPKIKKLSTDKKRKISEYLRVAQSAINWLDA